MNDEYGPDLVTLTDEDGVETEFEVLDAVEYEGRQYVALTPTKADPLDALDVVILEVQDDNGEEVLVSLEDEELYNELFDIFSDRLDEMFEEDENGEDGEDGEDAPDAD